MFYNKYIATQPTAEHPQIIHRNKTKAPLHIPHFTHYSLDVLSLSLSLKFWALSLKAGSLDFSLQVCVLVIIHEKCKWNGMCVVYVYLGDGNHRPLTVAKDYYEGFSFTIPSVPSSISYV